MARTIKFLTIALLWSVTTATAQQTGAIGGRVLDANTNEPLPGVNVAVQGTTFGAATNENGLFVIKNLPPGIYSLNATMIGFAPTLRAGVKVTATGTTPVVLRLAETLIEVPSTIVTASKKAQSFMETPSSVSVLSARQIAQHNFVTLDRVLEFMPSVNLMSGQISIRGSSGYSRGAGSRVLLLVDGFPMLPGDSGDIKWNALPAGEVDHIEVVKGAASALYGSSAIGGVLNVITKDPGDAPKTGIKLNGGIYDEPYYPEYKWTNRTLSYDQQDLTHENSFGKLRVRAAIGRRKSTGYSENGHYKNYSLYAKAKYLFSPTSTLMIFGNYADSDHGSAILWKDQNSPLEVPDGRENDTIFSSQMQTGGLLTTVLSGRVGMKVRGSYFRNRFEDRYFDNHDSAKSHNGEVETQLDVELGRGHSTTVGVAGSLYKIDATIFGEQEIRNFADYGQHEWKINEALTLSAGARFDYFWVDTGLREWQTTPKFGLVYAPKPSLSLRLSAGGGFRSPTGAEMFTSTSVSGFTVVPNRDLKSEHAWSLEVGGNFIFKTTRLNAAAFWNDYDDFIEGGFIQLNGNTVIRFDNIERTRIRGFEVELENSFWRQRLTLQTSYTYLDTHDFATKQELQYRPRHLLTLRGDFNISRFIFGADFRYASRVGVVAVFPNDPREEQRVLNLRLTANLKPVTVTANVYNALQWHYTQVERTLEPIRSFALTGNLDF